MTSTRAATEHGNQRVAKRAAERKSFYLWTAVLLGVCVGAVVLGWHARGGTPDPPMCRPVIV
jgi:hypothetical protein